MTPRSPSRTATLLFHPIGCSFSLKERGILLLTGPEVENDQTGALPEMEELAGSLPGEELALAGPVIVHLPRR